MLRYVRFGSTHESALWCSAGSCVRLSSCHQRGQHVCCRFRGTGPGIRIAYVPAVQFGRCREPGSAQPGAAAVLDPEVSVIAWPPSTYQDRVRKITRPRGLRLRRGRCSGNFTTECVCDRRGVVAEQLARAASPAVSRLRSRQAIEGAAHSRITALAGLLVAMTPSLFLGSGFFINPRGFM